MLPPFAGIRNHIFTMWPELQYTDPDKRGRQSITLAKLSFTTVRPEHRPNQTGFTQADGKAQAD